jgi:hypothetical protein
MGSGGNRGGLGGVRRTWLSGVSRRGHRGPPVAGLPALTRSADGFGVLLDLPYWSDSGHSFGRSAGINVGWPTGTLT